SSSFDEGVDKFGRKVGKAVDRQKRTFRPRMNRLMRKLRGAGSDVSPELTGNHQEDMVTLMLRNVQLQYETLKEVSTEKIRKGSFQDLASRVKDGKNNAVDKAKSKFDGVAGLFGKGGMLAGLMDKLRGGDEDGEG